MNFPSGAVDGDIHELWQYDSATGFWNISGSSGGGSGGLWTKDSDDIYYEYGKVGVKTTNPTHDLTVTGDAIISSGVTADVTGDVKATDGTKVLENGADGTDAAFTGDVTGDVKATDGTKVLENGADLAGSEFYGKVDGGSF